MSDGHLGEHPPPIVGSHQSVLPIGLQVNPHQDGNDGGMPMPDPPFGMMPFNLMRMPMVNPGRPQQQLGFPLQTMPMQMQQMQMMTQSVANSQPQPSLPHSQGMSHLSVQGSDQHLHHHQPPPPQQQQQQQPYPPPQPGLTGLAGLANMGMSPQQILSLASGMPMNSANNGAAQSPFLQNAMSPLVNPHLAALRQPLTGRGRLLICCDTCSKRFLGNQRLVWHRLMRPEDLKSRLCDVCGGAFDAKEGEEDKAETNEKGQKKPFVCKLCNASFYRGDRLLAHSRVHTGEKPFQCDLCPRSFSRKDRLKAHRRTHTGETPYKCSVCNKAFMQSAHLNKHMQAVHNITRKGKKRQSKKESTSSSPTESTLAGDDSNDDKSVSDSTTLTHLPPEVVNSPQADTSQPPSTHLEQEGLMPFDGPLMEQFDTQPVVSHDDNDNDDTSAHDVPVPQTDQ